MRQSKVFQFKQFSVDQSACAMKINTDGVLLGVLANTSNPQNILDIGTGTGVIALMLAQRFISAKIDAVEVDQPAAETAGRNFQNSSFMDRLTIYPLGFSEFFEQNPNKKYDLIVSNPPFYINSLKSPEVKKELAKHADKLFFEELLLSASKHLQESGILCMILPVDTAEMVSGLAAKHKLNPQKRIFIQSFSESKPHRVVVAYGFETPQIIEEKFVIYESVGKYSEQYINLLKPYFIAF
ncbi:MAG TPA: methyltransferase [Mucilaginibacter sp.]|jgi:tRNA1Val (adenine37-N6)-methyltransferase|nr:methyltransferase [Mucilaginibacter sp.]